MPTPHRFVPARAPVAALRAALAVSVALAATTGCSREEKEAAPGAPRAERPADAAPNESPDAEIARLVASFGRGQTTADYHRARQRLSELVPGRAAALRSATAGFETRARGGDVVSADVLDNVCDAIQMAADPDGAVLAIAWTSLPHPKLRLKAVQTVAGLEPPGASDALAARALDASEAATVRYAALEGLGLRGDPAVAPRLRPLLEETAPDLLARAVAALGLLGDAASADRLHALATTVDSPVALEAIRALVRLGDPRGLEKLEPLASSADAHFRLQAASLLASASTAPSMKRLEAMARDPEAAVRQAVVGGLGSAPAGYDADATLKALSTDRDDGVRRGALFTAAKAGAGWAIETLRALAADRASADRLAAMVSLGRCRDRASVSPLLSVAGDAKDESASARLTASNNLARIGDASVLPRLLEIATGAEGDAPNGEPLWRAIAVGLANFGAESIEPAVRHYRASPDARGKRVVVTVLRFVGGPNAAAARSALSSLRDGETDPELRREIDEALGR